MVRNLWPLLGVALAARAVGAQPVTQPDTSPLAEIRDDKQLAQALATIAQDPAVHVADPKARPLAAALMAEGVRQLQAHNYEQALANFLDAYDKLPSPKILLNIGSTLRDMGRLADAANTYQRYVSDPTTGPERLAEVKKLLEDLDRQLTLLTVHVSPKGSEISIDGGPFIAVGSSFVARVRPGIHLVRLRKDAAANELTINGFDGELKDVSVALPDAAGAPATTEPPRPLPTVRTPEEQVNGWLDTSTQYGTSDTASTHREVHAGYSGPAVRAIVPALPPEDADAFPAAAPSSSDDGIAPGMIGLLRIDGKRRGGAGGIGVAISPFDAVELELAVLRSNQWGAYTGIRVRLMTRTVRPYLGAGLAGFLYDDENDAMRTKIALGLRGAAGIEVRINGHLSLQGDLGVEAFVNVDDDALVGGKHPDQTVFVPTLGVIGRL